MQEFDIGENEAGQRFDKYLKKLLSSAPGSFIYKMLRKKNIVLNDKKADGTEKLKRGDCIKLYLSEETFQKFSAQSESEDFRKSLPRVCLESLPFQILYETEDILMINKPAGMLSQKAKPEDISANEYILSYLLVSHALTGEEFATFRPSVCNRLDRNTSGILIAGKTLRGLQEMSESLKQRSVQKFYRCIVSGSLKDSQHLKGWLHKDARANRVFVSESRQSPEDKRIETEYVPIRVFADATLLEVHLITGRSHQIRAHLASVGHPVIGDFKYGDGKVNLRFAEACEIHSQLLHAYRIRLADETEVTAPMPEDFLRTLHYLNVKEQ